MKTKFLLFILLFCCALSLSAQNPLIGTWQMQAGNHRSFKIITPTHWIMFTDSTAGDKQGFIRSHGGTYTLKGNKYVESIDIASWEGYGKEKTDYTFRVEGDKFYQKGTLTLGDGTVIPIDEVWQKVESASSYEKSQALGAWNQLSSSYTMADGKKESHTNATATRFQVITPTHWIRISHRDNKFENAMGGTYTAAGNTVYPKLDFASFPIQENEKIEIAQRLKGDKMYWEGVIKDENGNQTMQFSDVFQKAGNRRLAKATTKE